VIYSLAFGGLPFYSGDDEDLVSQMICVVGNLQNKEWQAKWEHMRLNCKYKLCVLKDGELPRLEQLMLLIRGLMRYMYQPSSRITASKALDVFRQKPSLKRKRLRR